jgi:WD40 repeat protein
LGSFDECHSDDVTCLKFHPLVPNAMISGSTDGLICLYQLSTFNQDDDLYQVIKDESVSKCGYFGPNYEYIYAISHMETLSIHKFLDSQLIESFGDLRIENELVKTDYLIDCEYNDQMQRLFLLTGSRDGNIGIFDVQLGKPNLAFTLNGGHKDTVLDVSWDWTNSKIFSCSEDGYLTCWKH